MNNIVLSINFIDDVFSSDYSLPFVNSVYNVLKEFGIDSKSIESFEFKRNA